MNKKAQNISEYAIIIGLIGSVLLMMSLYFQRGIQTVIKEPVDNLGGFGSGIFSAERIQEIGIEDNVDPKYGPRVLSQSKSSVDSTRTITTKEGGWRQLDVNENTKGLELKVGEDPSASRINEYYQRIEYDQVTRED